MLNAISAAVVSLAFVSPTVAADESNSIVTTQDYLPHTNTSQTLTLPSGEGSLTANVWRLTFASQTGNALTWNWQVSAVYSGAPGRRVDSHAVVQPGGFEERGFNYDGHIRRFSNRFLFFFMADCSDTSEILDQRQWSKGIGLSRERRHRTTIGLQTGLNCHGQYCYR